MGNRRSANRFVVPDAAQATLRLMQDVWVERVSTRSVLVVSDEALRVGEELELELPCELGMRAAVRVMVEAVTPATSNERRRHRLVLRILTPPQGRHTVPPPGGGYSVPSVRHLPAIGVLVRHIPVRVRDVSVSGCLMDSPDALPEGAVALIEVVLEGEPHAETVRICRAVRIPGGAYPWRAGAQFLGLGAPPPASVRNLVARFEILDEVGGRGTPGRLPPAAGRGARSRPERAAPAEVDEPAALPG